MKKKTKELQEKLNTKTTKRSLLGDKDNNSNNTKLKVININSIYLKYL